MYAERQTFLSMLVQLILNLTFAEDVYRSKGSKIKAAYEMVASQLRFLMRVKIWICFPFLLLKTGSKGTEGHGKSDFQC